MSTYAISDIHGCYSFFQKMLEQIAFSNEDTLIIAGDYIDRGSQNIEMLRWLEQHPPNAVLLRGNHDEDFLSYMKCLFDFIQSGQSGDVELDSHTDLYGAYHMYQTFLKENDPFEGIFYDFHGTVKEVIECGATLQYFIQWIDIFQKMPLLYKCEINGRQCVIVHAGYIESVENLQDKYESVEEFYLFAREDAYHYGGMINGTVIAGHTPTIEKESSVFQNGKVFRYYDEKKDCIYYDIDCGCAFRDECSEARLACLRLEDEMVFYV